MMSSPTPRRHDADLSDFLDHCVTIGEEVGDILDHFEQRVVVVVPGDLSDDHRPMSDDPILQPPANNRNFDCLDRGIHQFN